MSEEWPSWWDWELELSPHLIKRMAERGFSEIELRTMLETASSCAQAENPHRWEVESKLRNENWLIILEPDHDLEFIVVVTAYPVE